MRYCVVMEYDGSSYHGFQIQPNVITIQKVVEDSLKHIYQTDIKIVAASRTDAFVHAKHQVFHYDSDTIIPTNRLASIINKQLPPDIRVIEILEVSSDFHARYDVVQKEYRYIISKQNADVFSQRYVLFIDYEVDVTKIKQAMHYFVGEHDFRTFSKASDKESTTRKIDSFDLIEKEDQIIFSIKGNGFLHHMVRIIVGTLLEVGRGNLSPSDVKSILDEKNRVYAPFVAQPNGLYLWNILYKQDK
ncbi:MAG TPA: tRNA pseudouridine(38-40) synthase TruA [Bacilli bacterium]|nr:tRNA pseudouridine(38-40) synthase TruA [Bacilli bacterium]